MNIVVIYPNNLTGNAIGWHRTETYLNEAEAQQRVAEISKIGMDTAWMTTLQGYNEWIEEHYTEQP